MSAHGERVKAFIKDLASKTESTDEPLRIPSQLKEEAPMGAGAGAGVARRAAVAPTLETHSSYRENVKGEPSYRLSIQKVWKAFSDNVAGSFKKVKAGGYGKDFNAYVKEHLQDLSDKDFSDFLHNFLPPQLRDSGAFFERAARGENPNLMGFMYNYIRMLPKPLVEELRNRLMESAKIALAMPKNHMMTEGQLQFYARVLYNHVDNLVGSARFAEGGAKGEKNIFKSTAPEMIKKTKWMDDSLVERKEKDETDVKRMFSKHPEQQASALKMLNSFYTSLSKINRTMFKGDFDPQIPLDFKHESDKLADWLVKTSELKQSRLKLERWNYYFELK
jgi:hypothetical protein